MAYIVFPLSLSLSISFTLEVSFLRAKPSPYDATAATITATATAPLSGVFEIYAIPPAARYTRGHAKGQVICETP